jgi:hypothetical protein
MKLNADRILEKIQTRIIRNGGANDRYRCWKEVFPGVGLEVPENIVVKMRFTKPELRVRYARRTCRPAWVAWKRVVAPTISELRRRRKVIQCDWYRHNSYVLW